MACDRAVRETGALGGGGDGTVEARGWALVVANVVLTAALGLVTNVVSPYFPQPLNRPWLLWPVLAVMLVGLVTMAYRLDRKTGDGDEHAYLRREFLAAVRYRVADQGLHRRFPATLEMKLDIEARSGAQPPPLTEVEAFTRARTLLIFEAAGGGKTVALLKFALQHGRVPHPHRGVPVPRRLPAAQARLCRAVADPDDRRCRKNAGIAE